MEEQKSLSKMKAAEAGKVYARRRLVLAGVMAALALAVLVLLASGPRTEGGALPAYQDEEELGVPVFEEEPPEIVIPELPVNATNATNCTLAPIAELGCLEPIEGESIFTAQGMNLDDSSVKSLTKIVEKNCNTDNATGPVDRDCIIDTAVYNSDNSWVCEWDCLRDLASCETYKMHLAVKILRQYVPATEVFVARTQDFHFFLIYRDNQGNWIQKFAYGLSRPAVEALYNDEYHAGPITEVIFPDILEVEAGEKFCFDVYATRSCACKVEVLPFTVGECPQLPADLRGVCDKPIEEVYLNSGKNQICFTVADNATEEFYTYDFTLDSGIEYIPAGNAFMKYRQLDCCVNASFTGFLSIE